MGDTCDAAPLGRAGRALLGRAGERLIMESRDGGLSA